MLFSINDVPVVAHSFSFLLYAEHPLLTFRTHLFSSDASGWWQGILNGKKALFPGNYVEKL